MNKRTEGKQWKIGEEEKNNEKWKDKRKFKNTNDKQYTRNTRTGGKQQNIGEEETNS